MSAENSLSVVEQKRYDEVLGRLVGSPEIRHAFNNSIRQPQWLEVKPLLPLVAISLTDFFEMQQKGMERLLSVLPELYATHSDDREKIERSLVRDMAFLATSGIITTQEIETLFEYCRLSWSEYWPEGEFNYRANSILEPKISPRLPYEKHLSLESSYDQANDARHNGKRVVIVMGTFDFHSGHAEFLTAARELAGNGLLIAYITSDKEASESRPGEQVLNSKQRLGMVASHQGIDICVELPWEENYKEPDLFNLHMRDVHSRLSAHFRFIGELDERSSLVESQCNPAGTRLVYQRKERSNGLSSTNFRKKLTQ